MTTEYDYGDDALPKIGDNLMASLMGVADRQEALESEITKLEATLSEKKTALKEIAERTIPQMMDGIRGKIILSDGRMIEVTEKIRASIAGAKAAPAIKWLDDNEFGHIVKREFVVSFNKGEESAAEDFIKLMRDNELQTRTKYNQSVHHQTLEAFVREQLGEGVELPKDTFGIYRQRITKVSKD